MVKIKVEDIDYAGSTISGRRVNRDLIRELLGYAEKHELKNEIFPLDLSTLWYWNKVNTKKYLGRVCNLDDMKHSIALELHIKQGKEEEAVEYLRLKNVYSLRQYYKRASYQYFNY